MKKTPVLNEEARKRIDSYAEAIKNFGLKRLMNKLIDNKVLDPEYSYDTFKTQFRRLKENKTGPFLKPNFLYPILKHLDGFSYKNFFAEDETGKNKQTVDEIKGYLSIFSSTLKTELKNELYAVNKGSRSATPRDYIQNKDLLESAQKIVEAIGHGIINNDLYYNAIINLFFNITFLEKKTWKHGDSHQLIRIDGILRQLLQTTSNIYIFNEEGYIGINLSSVQNYLSVKSMLSLGNNYLVIAYQILLIEKLYNLYLKNTRIIEELKNKKTSDGLERSTIRVKLIRKISIEKNYDDIAGDIFRNCIKKFNKILDSRLESYYGLVWGFATPYKKDVPSSEYLRGQENIISFLHKILVSFVNPIEKDKPHGFGGFLPPMTFERLVRINKIEKNQVICLTNDTLKAFEELIFFFEKLEYQEIDEEQNKREETNFSKMKVQGSDGKNITLRSINEQKT